MATAVPTAMVGGSFDPIHLGHLHLVHTVARSTAYRRFIFVPVARNNFKQEANPALAEHRMQMLMLSFSSYGKLYPDDPPLEFVAEDCELRRGGISYTYDTVKYLYLQYSIKGRLAVVMGDDLLSSLHRWHAYEHLKELVTFVVIRRNGEVESFDDLFADMVYLDNPLLEDSSTRIREVCSTLSDQQPLPEAIAALMPKEVARYVQDHRLYRS
ncbi:MAG: nicotinate (nicotinamide) nucleotide adenylyltransferase [Sphaerochaeta sp.]|uniref:nicotinate (nicotinamide) nucleotide adenylyltransferase n=1 Tax=Sphaerochaeta sp. TaxID=1972642 RepID=UPI002FC8FEA9